MKINHICMVLILLLAACSPVATTKTADLSADAPTEADQPAIVAESTVTLAPTVTPDPTDTLAPAATAEPPTATAIPTSTPEPLSEEDAAAIYAAAVRQMYSVDHYFIEPDQFPLVYILSTTTDGSLLEAPITQPQKLSPELQQAIAAQLNDLQIEIIWAENRDEVPLDRGGSLVAEGQGILITPGNILPQDDGSVHLPFYMLCGPLCLSGVTYVLNETDGVWQVTDNVGAVIQG